MISVSLIIPSIRPDPLIRMLTNAAMAAQHTETLQEREPNHSWAFKMREKWIASGCDVGLTLQDDTIVPEDFAPMFHAMLSYLPTRSVLGLASSHPLQTEIYRQGHRYYRTKAWVIGWGYAMHMVDVEEFHKWTIANPIRTQTTNEDSLLNEWIIETSRDVWHPVPAIIDHDTSLASTYANDDHVHRRPMVTWRDVDADLTHAQYWLPSGQPPLLDMPKPRHCWHCLKRPAVAGSSVTRAGICAVCLGQYTADLFGRVRL